MAASERALELTMIAAHAAAEKLAEDIVALDTIPVLGYFVEPVQEVNFIFPLSHRIKNKTN